MTGELPIMCPAVGGGTAPVQPNAELRFMDDEQWERWVEAARAEAERSQP